MEFSANLEDMSDSGDMSSSEDMSGSDSHFVLFEVAEEILDGPP